MQKQIEVTPFSEMEIATTEVFLLSLIAREGVLPTRMQLAPLRMKATLREMALERLAAGATRKPPPPLVFPEKPSW